MQCPRCGLLNQPGMQFCGRCGLQFTFTTSAPPRTHWKTISLIIGVIGITGLVLFGGYRLRQPDPLPPVRRTTPHDVVYRVLSNEGEAAVSLVYRDKGQVVRHGDRDSIVVTTPWSIKTTARTDMLISLTAERKSGSKARCEIEIDGEVVVTQEEDEYQFFQCRLTAP